MAHRAADSYMAEENSLFLEGVNFRDHVFDVGVDLEEVCVKDSFTGFAAGEAVEFGEWDVSSFFLGDFRHVEVGLAEELGGLALIGVLDIEVVTETGLSLALLLQIVRTPGRSAKLKTFFGSALSLCSMP